MVPISGARLPATLVAGSLKIHLIQGQMDNSGQVGQEVGRNGRIRLRCQANEKPRLRTEKYSPVLLAMPQRLACYYIATSWQH